MTCPVGGGALPTAREVPRGSNSVHAHASGTRSAAPRGICRVTAIVCCSLRQTSAGNWPPSTHATRRTARTSQPRGDRGAGEASGTDIQLGPDGRREGAISRGSNFGLWRREEGKRKEKPPVFLYYMSHSLYILFLEFGLEFGFSMYSKGAAPNSKPNSKNRYKGKLASENLARIWRASIERTHAERRSRRADLA